MMNSRFVFLAIAFGLLVIACGSGGSHLDGDPGSEVRLVRVEARRIASPDTTEGRVTELVRGNNAFAFGMYRAHGGDGNLIFSPYSISLAFSMAYAGARGETEGQMAEVMHFLPQDAQHPAFNALEQRMSGLGQKRGGDEAVPFRFNIANATWGQRGYPFERAYLETLAGHYGAGLRTLDFRRPQEASDEINSWIEDQTEDRIRDLVSPEVITPGTRLVLSNAIYFNASWMYSFEEANTRSGPFTLSGGKEITAPLMRQTTYLPYAEGDGYQAVLLPYKGEAVDMLLVLPDKGRFEQVEKGLGADFLDAVRGGMRREQVRLTMPRFEFETDLALAKLLKTMGMTDAFDSGTADFSGITGKGDLYISAALHRANVSVDERGTEAAAATVLAMAESAALEPVEVTANRPFVFAIVERESGTVLFLGRVMDPSS